MNTGDDIITQNAKWNFGQGAAQQFDVHVSKSVPLYNQGHDLICRISDFFLSDNSVCYDIGCSTGTLLQKLASHNAGKKVEYYGIEIEPDMVSLAQKKCDDADNISIVCDDILNLELKKADLIISYYTIQFTKPRIRQLIFNKIYEALNWGGALLLFEKVRGADARFQDISSALYIDYKLEQGYTEEQILNKSRSLKGVLEPFSTQGNLNLMSRAGFVDIATVMKYVCFEGFMAIK
jgi:tRNA (cmo5U34)-methyltransferase